MLRRRRADCFGRGPGRVPVGEVGVEGIAGEEEPTPLEKALRAYRALSLNEGVAVRANVDLCPGLTPLLAGAALLALAAVRTASGVTLGPGQCAFEIGHCVVGAALVLWGWSRRRRAKAVHPG